MSVKPYKNSPGSKKRQVEEMFDNISGKYDFLNHFLSFNIDRYWRKNAVSHLKNMPGISILDVATGTGDMITPLLKLRPKKITGLDLSEGMLSIARKKFPSEVRGTSIEFIKGDSEKLPFDDNMYDAETVAFGVRNFENTLSGLSEMFRVLKPDGKIVVLEFARPGSFPFKQIYQFYFRNLLPFFGRIVSDDKDAYTYLPDSVNNFPERKEFVNIMENAGFSQCTFNTLTFGIVSVYTGIK